MAKDQHGEERGHDQAREAPQESDYIAPGLYRWMLDQPPIPENTISGIDELRKYEQQEKLHTLFGHISGKHEGDADQFLATCDLVDDEVKEAIALIMRKCSCDVVFGDAEHKIDATAGGRVGEVYCSVGGKRKIAILIGD